jgi:dihydroneopterin aldolase
MGDEAKCRDWVRLLGMVFDACHGVNDWEKVTPAQFEVDVEILADLSKSGGSDELTDTIDYSAVYAAVRDVMNGESRNLLERLATEIADRMLAEAACEQVRVRLRKMQPPVGGECRVAEIEILRNER